MEFNYPILNKEYQKLCRLLGGNDEYQTEKTLGIHDVLRAHFLIVEHFFNESINHNNNFVNGIGGIGPKDINLLHSAMYRQFVSFGGIEKWNDEFKICATLLYGIIKDHPFHDANKRTALLSCLFHLQKLKYVPTIDHKRIEDFVVEIADNKLKKYKRLVDLDKKSIDEAEVYFIADYLKRNTRKIDKKKYMVTYKELNNILKRFDCELINPKGFQIDVVRYIKKRKMFGGEYYKQQKVFTVGFAGWGKQASKKHIYQVRDALGLTAEKGIDSESFFKGTDTLASLIDNYRGPLKRLSDR